nr:methyltransferase domain-containing protein [Actinomycetota bacterium]
ENGLDDKSIDTIFIIFICDAFHEFTDKRKTVLELYRVLKPSGNLAILEENKKYTDSAQKIVEEAKLFEFIERNKMFIKFIKPG